MATRAATGLVFVLLLSASPTPAAEAGRGEVYAVVELAFLGPSLTARDCPARDVDLLVVFRHESGAAEHGISGFWDGDGQGAAAGNVWKVRFCPTRPGRWDIVDVRSNVAGLRRQRRGDHVAAAPSKRPGFWEVDADSPGRRWYRRSDGSHPFVFGNTQYSFLSGYGPDGPTGVDIAADVAANARYFKKLRFGLGGDRYPHPAEKPFLDGDGRPTESGDHSHRPNPRWFRQRVDVAVRAAFDHDLVADLILCGPDTEDSRATLRAAHNGGDPTPYLRYIAARYGSYPNVWLCVSNEYDIKSPKFTDAQAVRFGQTLRAALPYPTPVSIHASQHPPGGRAVAGGPAWSAGLDVAAWNDHQIVQRKLKSIAAAADVNQQTWRGTAASRDKPTVNDELSYQGEGDRHTEADTVASHLGAFLGGGYASTGEKRGNKLGQYFWGGFDPSVHTAAHGLKWLRERIDAEITFWKMAPDAGIFPGLDPRFRAMSWPGREYVLGTDAAAAGLVAELPAGAWTVNRFDVLARTETTLSTAATGRFPFDAPPQRAVLFHFKRNAE